MDSMTDDSHKSEEINANPPDVPNARHGASRIAGLLILMAVTLIGALLIAELALRLTAPLKERRDRYYAGNTYYQQNPDWVRYDPVLGYVNIPNINVQITRPEIGGFTMDIRTNSAGYRDNDASLNNPDLLVLGDSYCFGWGVQQNETCEAVLERDLRVKALNMGVSGYGTVQQYIQIRDWCRKHNMQGKTVLVLFFSNDWIESCGGGADVYPTFASTNPCTETVRQISPDKFSFFIKKYRENRLHGLPRSSELARRLSNIFNGLRGRSDTPKGWEHTIFPPYQPLKEMVEAENCAVANMARLQHENGFNLVFAYIPSVSYYEGEEWVDFDYLSPILKKHGIPLIDLRPALSREDYWLLDRHWKASGHRKASLAIESAFKSMGLFARQPPHSATPK